MTAQQTVPIAVADIGSRGTDVFRGVARGHPGYDNALQGVVFPRGGDATVAEHNAGNTMSNYSSWTTERWIAEKHADYDGIVLRVNLADYPGRWMESPDRFFEHEVLIEGSVRNAKVLNT